MTYTVKKLLDVGKCVEKRAVGRVAELSAELAASGAEDLETPLCSGREAPLRIGLV